MILSPFPCRRASWLAVVAVLALSLSGGSAMAQEKPARPRAREAGVIVGVLPAGPNNAITDVPGVRVGHVTLVKGDNVRTGVTAVLPHGGNLFAEKVPGAVYVGNGFGKLMGATQVNELGEIETPILLTATLNVPRTADALLDYMLALPGNEEVGSVNPLVAETNDGVLNDVRGRHVGAAEVRAAIAGALGGAVEEGSVGAGTGTIAFGFKGGIGTSSRVVEVGGEQGVIATLVQSNFGGRLTVDGVSMQEVQRAHRSAGSSTAGASLMMIVATDLPLSNRLLNRVSKRATLGMARTGSSGGHSSGDYVIAFSTTYRTEQAMPRVRRELADNERAIDVVFQAVADATEEAILNSLFRAHTVVGASGNTLHALPLEPVLERLRAAGRL